MDKPCNARRPAGQNMTRGEFLATGAVAAVGGAVGGIGDSPGYEAMTSPPPIPQQCATGCDVNNLARRWAAPSGVINALWGDVLPRVVADAWNVGDTIPSAGMLNTWLRNRMDRFFPAAFNPAQSAGGWDNLNPVAEVRFNRVKEYLDQSTGQMPIRFVEEGGYDFMLSDRGMDIFLPKKPPTLREMLRYYTFRGTGRRPIGTPNYLWGALTATSTDSPTGPGQIVSQPITVVFGILESVQLDLHQATCEMMIDCAVRRLGVDVPAVPGRWTALWRILNPDWQQEWRVLGLSVEPEGDPQDRWTSEDQTAFERLTAALREPGALRTDRQRVACLLRGFRCWQVEGSVYRAIMTEFPRVVAEAWLEEEMQVAADDLNSYRYRIDPRDLANPSTPVTGRGEVEREVFEERLETMLPAPTQMHFQAVGPNRQVPASGVWAPNWKGNDVMVTNTGFFHPPVEVLASAFPGTMNSTERLNEIFAQIRAGRAGNPVFTDSMRTEGGGEE